MPTPPEAAMLHMQHAHVVAQLVRRHEAAQRAERDALARARHAAAPETVHDMPRTVRGVRVHGPRPA